jgi:membrane protein YqaA with SNARE-associated domain
VTRDPLDRAAIVLGAAGVLVVLLAPLSGDPWELVQVGAGAAVLTAVLGGLAIVGGRTARAALVLAAGGGYLAGAALQLAQFGRDTNWLGGSGSTVSYFLGLGAGLLTVAFARRSDPDHHQPKDA